MRDLIVPPAWQALASEPFQGRVILIGGPDSGKTSLAFYLYQQWTERGVEAALLDCDIGQSILGLPATMNLRVATSPNEHQDFAYFVGSITPRRYMLPMLVGLERLRCKAEALGAKAVIVDTTGLIDPAQGGAALKECKIELLMPCRVIALRHQHELSPILRSWQRHPAVRVTQLAVPRSARTRNRTERVEWRRERWQSYFAKATPVTLPFSSLAMIDWILPTAQKVCAFVDAEGFCLGLGRVAYLDRKVRSITIETPLYPLDAAVGLRFGPPHLEEQVLGNSGE